MFCKRCGSIMLPKEKNGKKGSGCSKCSYYEEGQPKVKFSEEVKVSPDIEIVEESKETLPKIEAECSKCKHKTAYYWTMQTRAADEGETKFLKCEKCKHVWRDYG